MYLKKKRCGRIKGRGCADGRKQRSSTSKEDASSPTVAIESVMLSCTIDAKEGRDIATCDIPGVFLQADMDELVRVRLEGTMAELMARLDPKLYRKYVMIEHGKPALCVELLTALYGTMRASLLFWKKLSQQLVSWGFEINPHDWCVANKTINGKQCTVLWHVDDLKISHLDPDVVTGVINDVSAAFGKDAPITVTRGRVHEYLGMTLDFSEPGKFKVKMIDYVNGMLDSLPDDMSGTAATPAGDHLFEVNNDNPTKLDEETAQLFHHLVAKSLFLCKRARPDLQTAVAFLSTRVKEPDLDDYKKVKRMMEYLRDTRGLYLTLEAEDLHVIKWWIDASFAVHPDMKSHTGGCLSLGKGSVYGTSTRQKLNTKSSTEAELVGVNDVLPQVLWTRYFLEAQGYEVRDNVQDNQSTMLLANNGRGSSGKRTRHIEIRYFFVTDRISQKQMRVACCPTKEMIADYFTKPLQGALFRRLRDAILNIPQKDGSASMENVDTPTLPDPRSVLKGSGTVEGQTWAQVVAGNSLQNSTVSSGRLAS